jgi:tripartite-type tricarboxylate transporter receptor subunit TctC
MKLPRRKFLHLVNNARNRVRENAMKLPRRQFLHLAAGVAALPAMSRLAGAQTYPSRPVRIIVGFPAGGSSDLYARLMAQWLSERLGQQFIVENRAGAGGNLGTEAVARATPDGYTLGVIASGDAWNATLYENLSFSLTRDIAPVGRISRGMGVVVVHPSFPGRSLPDLLANAKANPGKLTMASAGVGSASHVWGELLKAMARVDMLHVPYRGGGAAVADLIGGHVQVMVDTLVTAVANIRSGALRALAVTDSVRTTVLPNIPTVSEFIAGYEATGWTGIGAPRDTPAEIIQVLNKEINAALDHPPIKARLTDLAVVPSPMMPVEFGKFIVEYTDKWAKVIREANIKL